MQSKSLITQRARFFWFLGLALAVYGFFSWFTVAKEEDPRIKPRFGTINIIYPGASPAELNSYVVRELEKELTAVRGIENVDIRIRPEFAFVRIELKGSVATDAAITREWDEVENALRRAELKYPKGVVSPELNRKTLDQEAILIAFTGPAADRHRALIALENEVLRIKDVASAVRIGDDGRQITLALDRSRVASSGLTPAQILAQLSAANQRLGGGSFDAAGEKINVKPHNGFETISEIENFSLIARNGGTIALKTLAGVGETERRPVADEMRLNGKPASALGVVARSGIDLVAFGDQVAAAVKKFQPGSGIEVMILNSQPEFVRGRLRELALALLESMAILGAMMLLTMGFRVGLLVTLMLPVVGLITLALNGIAGGVLQQISIAAFVMSLGLLIDNIIVVAESVQEKLDSGLSRAEAAVRTVKTFTVPLLSSTLTTVASFLPMLLARGTTAEFTFAIPAIAITALSVSWLAAVYLTPAFAAAWLRPGTSRQWPFLSRVADLIAETVLRRTRRIGYGIIALLAIAVISAATVGQKFFPSADRNQLVVEIVYPEGTALSRTRSAVEQVERFLSQSAHVSGFAAFVGRSTPRFYYNLNQEPNSPQLAQVLVLTRGQQYHAALQKELAALALEKSPRVIVRSLEQGPPIPAPVEIRLVGDDALPYAEKMVTALKGVQGMGTLRHDSEGTIREYALNGRDGRLAENGLTRADLALAALATTRGIAAGFYRTSDETLPIVVGYPEGENASGKSLAAAIVGQTTDRAIIVADSAVASEHRHPGIINRRNRENVVRILAETDNKLSSAQTLSLANAYLAANPLPQGVRREIGGESGESLKANGAILAALPLAMIILIAILIWEFNSIKLTAIIMTAVPTAALGIMPGLAIGRQPMGFMGMLALFALIGIVVNNGILLIDRFRSAEQEGHDRQSAVRIGILERLRPILLTSGSTILGMVPLTFTNSTLWPPFAWAMISGLAVSTLFTLFIVPWLYAKMHTQQQLARLLSAAAVLLICAPGLSAEEKKIEPISVSEVIEGAARSPAAKAAWHRAAAAKAGKNTEILGVWGPRVTAGAEYIMRDREFFLQTPLGQFPYGRQNYGQVGVELYQTLWSADGVLAKIPSSSLRFEAAELMATWETMSAQHTALGRFFDCAEISARSDILKDRLQNIKLLRTELKRLIRGGKARDIDDTKAAMRLAEAQNSLQSLADAAAACEADLGRLTNSAGGRRPERRSSALQSKPEQVALDKRADLQALALLVEAARKERDGILLESLPEIYARGNYTHFGARQFTPEDWFQASVGARIRILDGGTQITRHQAKEAAYQEKNQQYADAIQAARVQLDDIVTRCQTAQVQVLSIQSELKAAEVRLSGERARVSQGRVAATDLLEALDIYWRRREALVLTELQAERLYWTRVYLTGALAK